MQKADSPLGKWRYLALFLPALVAVAADQLTKNLWIGAYPYGQVIFDVGFLRIVHAQNTGGVFGLFQGQSFALTILALFGVAIFLIVALFWHRRFPVVASLPSIIAIGLIIGGLIGNLIDRIRLGYVIDFIDFRVWPAFNIADSSGVVGIIIFAYMLLHFAIKEKH
jgi:signal peptidase II